MTSELSCYTAALVEHLGSTSVDRLVDSIHLWVRFHSPDGALAFSHHDRVDDGELSYASSADWQSSREQLLELLARHGSVIAVGNTRYLPWSPHHGVRSVAHWLVLQEHVGDRWWINDPFHALLPAGEHRPFDGWITDVELRDALTPIGVARPAQQNRDIYALGAPVDAGDCELYRWLNHDGSGTTPWQGDWVREPAEVLARLSDRLAVDEHALREHAEDLWTAARHHHHKHVCRGEIGLANAWSQIPKSVRFAVDSAARGRPRPGVVQEALNRLVELIQLTEA